MQSRQNGNIVTSFKNQFDDYNANVLAPDLIVQYWCTPFNTGALKGFDESSFFAEKMPIVLQGSRGSGKTTILKYFSFPVQRERAQQNSIPIRLQIVHDGGVGFYLRCDDSFLSMFKTVFSVLVKEAWQECFKHYLELFFSKNILTMISEVGFADIETEKKFVKQLRLDTFEDSFVFDTVDEIREYLEVELRYINKFRNEALFTNAKFSPKHVWDFYELSGLIISAVKSEFADLSGLNFLLLIDEFENLPTELQEMFNNIIKFCKPGMSLRIGRRSENENVVTKATVNAVEYLREGSDYRLIVLDYQGSEVQDLKPYLAGIAEKRLEAFEGISISSDISRILGEKEDLDTECRQLVAGRNKHLHELLKTNSRLSKNDDLRDRIVSIISANDNVLAVTLCALWVARSTDEDLVLSAQAAVSAMNAYLNKTEDPQKEKFKSDYDNKYRYALTTLICSLYKKDKSYYSFNTICYLSEGNARTFINLVKAIISDALFYERKQFLKSGEISVSSQCRAIKEFSTAEFNSVCSIIQDGKSVKNLILKIGNILSEYHKDKLVRYPETTQFVYDLERLSVNGKAVVDTAESWALIKRRKEKQRLSAGVGQEGYLCAINRVFAPIFNISYRIRGGVNVIFSAADIDSMISGEQISKLSTGRKKHSLLKDNEAPETEPAIQMSIFDGGTT